MLLSGVLLAASVLDADGHHDEARELISGAAPTYCALTDPRYISISNSDPALFEYALEHAVGPLLGAEQLTTLAERTTELLTRTTSTIATTQPTTAPARLARSGPPRR